MVNDYTNARGIEIGDIDIMQNFSFFEAQKSYAEEILNGFQGKFFYKRKINLEVAEGKKKEAKTDFRRDKKRKSFRKESVKQKTKRRRRRK